MAFWVPKTKEVVIEMQDQGPGSGIINNASN